MGRAARGGRHAHAVGAIHTMQPLPRPDPPSLGLERMRARFTASGIAAGAAYVAVFMMTVLRPSAMTVVVALGLECALLAVAVLSATVAIFAWVLTRHVGYAVSMWTL